jgi:hypothetical protein
MLCPSCTTSASRAIDNERPAFVLKIGTGSEVCSFVAKTVVVLDRICYSGNEGVRQNVEGSVIGVGPGIMEPSFNFEKALYH